jgi:hypothetical protein
MKELVTLQKRLRLPAQLRRAQPPHLHALETFRSILDVTAPFSPRAAVICSH